MTSHARVLAVIALLVGCSDPSVVVDAGSDAARGPVPEGDCVGSGGATLDGPYGPTAAGWSVHAFGSFTYDAPSATAGVATELTATLVAVQSSSSTLRLVTATESTYVMLESAPAAWIDALPVGRDVIAHFENGLVLRDAADGALLLAVAEGLGYGAPAFDVGPIHVAGAGLRCTQVVEASPVCGPGLYNSRLQLDVTFTLGATTIAGVAGAAPTRLVDGSDAFEVALIGSVVQGSAACEGAREGATFVSIGRTGDAR